MIKRILAAWPKTCTSSSSGRRWLHREPGVQVKQNSSPSHLQFIHSSVSRRDTHVLTRTLVNVERSSTSRNWLELMFNFICFSLFLFPPTSPTHFSHSSCILSFINIVFFSPSLPGFPLVSQLTVCQDGQSALVLTVISCYTIQSKHMLI